MLRSQTQFRVSFSGVFGLDYSAVLAMGAALDAPLHMLADFLPDLEHTILAAMNRRDATPDEDPPQDG